MSTRERMLARIRERQGRSAAPRDPELAAVRAYLASHERSPAPRDASEPAVRFRERALSLASTLDEAASLADVPARIAPYLRERALPLRAVCWRELLELDWAGSGMEVECRPARGDDFVGITGAACAIAETGTLVTLSGPETPPSVSLLPETHIAVVPRSRIVRNMEDAWAHIRHQCQGDRLPRAVSFISGPSRTADIEQTVTLGAHGPYRVHIVVVP
jgi:L-lactate dehydrogenase complex protein LldG